MRHPAYRAMSRQSFSELGIYHVTARSTSSIHVRVVYRIKRGKGWRLPIGRETKPVFETRSQLSIVLFGHRENGNTLHFPWRYQIP